MSVYARPWPACSMKKPNGYYFMPEMSEVCRGIHVRHHLRSLLTPDGASVKNFVSTAAKMMA